MKTYNITLGRKTFQLVGCKNGALSGYSVNFEGKELGLLFSCEGVWTSDKSDKPFNTRYEALDYFVLIYQKENGVLQDNFVAPTDGYKTVQVGPISFDLFHNGAWYATVVKIGNEWCGAGTFSTKQEAIQSVRDLYIFNLVEMKAAARIEERERVAKLEAEAAKELEAQKSSSEQTPVEERAKDKKAEAIINAAGSIAFRVIKPQSKFSEAARAQELLTIQIEGGLYEIDYEAFERTLVSKNKTLAKHSKNISTIDKAKYLAAKVRRDYPAGYLDMVLYINPIQATLRRLLL